MQEEWGHELPAEEGVYTGEVVTGEVVGEVVSGGPVEGEVYGKVVPVEVAGEQPAARIDLPPGRYPATGLSQWKWGHKPHGSAGTYRAHNVREGGHWQCEGHPGYRGQMQPVSEERRAVIAGRHQNALCVWEGPYSDKGMYENDANDGTQRWMLLPEGVLRVDHIHWGWAARGSTDYEAGGFTYYFAPPQPLLDQIPSPAVQIDRTRRLVRVDGIISTPLDLLASPELADFHQQGWLHLGSGMSFAARIRKTWVSNKETPANLSRVFSFGNTKGGSPNSDFTDEIGVRSWPGPNVTIYAYGAEGAGAKVTGWTQAAGAWIENEEALYLFTVGADGTLQMFKNGHCIGTAEAEPMRSMARRYLYVGGHPFWKDHYFRGTIRDVHIWDRPVTWDELVATGPGWMAAPPSGLWKGEFTSRKVGRGWNRYELQFEDGGTVTAMENNQYLQQSGRGSWTRGGAFVMNFPNEFFTGTVARRGGKWRIEGHFRRNDGGDDGPQWEEYAPLEAPGTQQMNPAPAGTSCCTIA